MIIGGPELSRQLGLSLNGVLEVLEEEAGRKQFGGTHEPFPPNVPVLDPGADQFRVSDHGSPPHYVGELEGRQFAKLGTIQDLAVAAPQIHVVVEAVHHGEGGEQVRVVVAGRDARRGRSVKGIESHHPLGVGLHPRAADEPPLVDGQIQHVVTGPGQLLGVIGVGGTSLLPKLEGAGIDVLGREDLVRRLGEIDPGRPEGNEPEPPREEVPLARTVGRSDLDGAVHDAAVEIGGPVETRLPDVFVQVVEQPEAASAHRTIRSPLSLDTEENRLECRFRV